jgi:hypothetical protein
MQRIYYISFLLFISFIFNSCKMRYFENFNTPYSIFKKGTKLGVINISNKQVIIPAKFGWIEEYYTKFDDPSSVELYYLATYPRENNSFFYLRNFLYNSNGKLIYTFGVGESIKTFFYYKKQLYLITKTLVLVNDKNEEFKRRELEGNLILIDENKTKILLNRHSIDHVGSKNIISFKNINQFDDQQGFFDLNSKKIIILNSNDFNYSMNVENKNEVWFQKYKKEKGEYSKYYDIVLDSTLNIKPNPFKNVLTAYEKFFFTENEKGIEINDFEGKTSPFVYPFLMPVKNRIIYDDIHPDKYILLDKLFVFSSQKEGVIKGIIDIDGKIILPEKFINITIRHVYYNTTPSEQFRTYIKENNLEKFYYFTLRNSSQEDEYTLYNIEGIEIINFKHGKDMNCSPEFDLMEKNQLQIKFQCSDSLKIYDLKTKKQIASKSNRGY